MANFVLISFAMSLLGVVRQSIFVISGPKNFESHDKSQHDDVIKWKRFLRYWPFVQGIHRCPVNSPHKGQWRGALMFSLICTQINSWVNNGEAGDLRRHHAYYDVIVMTNSNASSTACWRQTTKKSSKLHITSLWEQNPVVAGGFSSQRVCNAVVFPSQVIREQPCTSLHSSFWNFAEKICWHVESKFIWKMLR